MFKRRWLTIYFVSGLLLLSAAAVWAQSEGDTPDAKDAHLVIDEDEGAAPVATQAPAALPETTNTAISEHLALDDAFAIVGNAPQFNNVFMPNGVAHTSGDLIFVSSGGNGKVNGVDYRDEDILVYDTATSAWHLFFDAADVGIKADVNGFAFLLDGSLLLTLNESEFIPGVGEIQNTDVVRFIPTRWGSDTMGHFEMVFDGSDVGLAAASEEIDALDVLEDGRLVISTRGKVRIGPAWRQFRAADEDLLLFTPTQLGHDTEGSWAIYRSGLALGFDKTRDILALWQGDDEVYVTLDGTYFTIVGANGTRTDALVYAGSNLDVNIQANVNASNFSLAAANSSGLSSFDGLAIIHRDDMVNRQTIVE
ncbi:MAG: hypothetical protein AAF614_15090 [Chloroflexota bacterium]